MQVDVTLPAHCQLPTIKNMGHGYELMGVNERERNEDRESERDVSLGGLVCTVSVMIVETKSTRSI